MAASPRKFVLDTNCFIEASRTDAGANALAEFSARAAPRLYLSTVVAAELRAGVRSASDRRTLDRRILLPYVRRRRLVNPSAAPCAPLATTLRPLFQHQHPLPGHTQQHSIFD